MKPLHPVVARLKQERLQARMTQAQVARRLALSKYAMQGREEGKYEPASLADLDRWAALFGLQVALVPIDAGQPADDLGEAS
jgi:transcriptional regulator with XRE-family HTH domain